MDKKIKKKNEEKKRRKEKSSKVLFNNNVTENENRLNISELSEKENKKEKKTFNGNGCGRYGGSWLTGLRVAYKHL